MNSANLSQAIPSIKTKSRSTLISWVWTKEKHQTSWVCTNGDNQDSTLECLMVQDWADMLLRMYVRWGERQRYKTRVVDKSIGEEGGIKSATIELQGRYAFGYLSGEKGTYRIIRKSPFDAKGLRQTSFSDVQGMPLLHEDSLNLEIPEEDLQIGLSRAGGNGGQNVNKVETAVRITHIPTSVTVGCTGTAFSPWSGWVFPPTRFSSMGA